MFSKINRVFPFLVQPGTLWLLLFTGLPLLVVLNLSFLSRNSYGRVVYEYTIANYTRLLQWEELLIILRSMWLSLEVTLLCLLFGYPLALFLSRAARRLQPFLLLLVIVPFWTSSLVRTYAWITILQTEGLLNSFLMSVGWTSEPLTLLYNHGAILLGMTYNFLPFMILPVYASLQKLDPTLIDAARDLGASSLQVLLRIILPLSKGGIISGAILVFIPALGYFFIPDLMGGNRVILVSNHISLRFTQARDWPYGAALSVALIVLTLLLIAMFLRWSKRSGEKVELA